MNTKEKRKLPDGWVICDSKSTPGRKYFFNKKTGKSSWTYPQVDRIKKKISRLKPKKNDSQQKGKKPLKRKNDGATEEHASVKQIKKAKKASAPEKDPVIVTNIEILLQEATNDNLIKPKQQKSQSPAKTPQTTPTKNSANARLQRLRASLTAEINDEVTTEETTKIALKHKIGLTSPSEVPCKNSKLEPKNSLNDSKPLASSQSPSSDVFQSSLSPSQFFAANRILSSMKAQLPDEYKCKVRQKNAFAEIEQGICNQVSEYPSTKHPATPPQFSEASKLVSAIKSKLSYNLKDSDIRKFSSAKDRMEALRADFSGEVNEKQDAKSEIAGKAMDVDYEQAKACANSPRGGGLAQTHTEDLVLVVDTNIFIHELDCIKNVLNSHIKGYSAQPTLLVPWRVINELDRLKDNNNGNGAICKRARAAMDYLYKLLPENSRIKGQSLRDANSHIYPCESPDDEILNCCLQQKDREKNVVVLSNDKNLCNKAMTNGVKCMSLNKLKASLESKPQAALDPHLETNVEHYKDTIYQLLSNILENEMRATYNNLWLHVLFKAPPWGLRDVLQCLLKHWIAVFNNVFPRIEHLITDLKNALEAMESKDPKTLSTSEVTNFKELCLEVAKRCQIIPEYMHLAKITVDRLERKGASEPASGGEGGDEAVVINAFEGLWTVFSSYCAKLSVSFGVAHALQDKLSTGDPLQVLIDRYPVYSNQINALAHALNSVLSVDDPVTEKLTQLETVFKESLVLIHMDTNQINKENIRRFCLKHRNMLEEANTKFLHLTELLDTCKEHISRLRCKYGLI